MQVCAFLVIAGTMHLRILIKNIDNNIDYCLRWGRKRTGKKTGQASAVNYIIFNIIL